MDKDGQARVRELLKQTREDERLSRGEAEELDEVVDELQGDPEALAFFRNEAFRQAKAAIEASPTAVLRWLERVDKIVDRVTRPSAPPADAFEHVAFSPGEDCLSLIRSVLGSARASVDVCVFTITDNRITKALIAAHRRGVRVRIVSDDDKAWDTGSDIQHLRDAGVLVRTDQGDEHMHHKYAVIDDRLLLNGSYNWTRGATENHENLLATSRPPLVEAYRRHFDGVWAAFGP